MTEICSPDDVLRYWYGEDMDTNPAVLNPPNKEAAMPMMKRWFMSGTSLDEEIRAKFIPTIRAAGNGTLSGPEWETDRGIVARIILLDQFTRNAFRGSAEAFSYDEVGLKLARDMFKKGFSDQFPDLFIHFASCPLMHSESIEDKDLCITECRRLFDADREQRWKLNDFTIMANVDHRDVLVKFGRYPHRNKALQRETTPEEQAFLSSPDCPPWAKSQG